MLSKRRDQARRIPFDQWMDSFAEANDAGANAVLQRLEKGGIHADRILMLLWFYSSAPSQEDLQAVLLASDRQLSSLCRLLRHAAAEIERLNKRVAASQFIEIVQRSGILPNYDLPSGVNLKDIPLHFKLAPTVLRHYQHAVEVGRHLVKKAIADRPLFRNRILQLLHFAMKFGDPKTSPSKNIATLVQAAFFAAGVADREVHEANLQRQLKRFKNARPKDVKSALVLAALVNDQPFQWNGLLLAYLVTEGLVRNLVPV